LAKFTENKEPIYAKITGNKIDFTEIGIGNNGNRKNYFVSAIVSNVKQEITICLMVSETMETKNII